MGYQELTKIHMDPVALYTLEMDQVLIGVSLCVNDEDLLSCHIISARIVWIMGKRKNVFMMEENPPTVLDHVPWKSHLP